MWVSQDSKNVVMAEYSLHPIADDIIRCGENCNSMWKKAMGIPIRKMSSIPWWDLHNYVNIVGDIWMTIGMLW